MNNVSSKSCFVRTDKSTGVGVCEVRKHSGFSEFGIVSVPPGDAVAF